VNDLDVRGFANTKTKITYQGTVQWTIVDDEGRHRHINIANAYYVPGCDVRLLSPQHWSLESNDHYPVKDGTWCATYNDRIEIY
jgi:hypothetical protein